MIAQLRSLWHDVNASYWFYPALFSFFSFLLALLTVYLDRNGYADFLNNISWIDEARSDGARNILTVIAGSMIGVASTVFSITIAAVAYASGNYGPRLLTNFMEDRGNQLSLATFIGTFVYAITVLRSVRGEDEASLIGQSSNSLPGFVPQLSLLVAFILVVISIMVLVFFLNHIPASIRINTVLEGIGRRLLTEIDSRFRSPNRGAVQIARPGGIPVLSSEVGYIQMIDFKTLRSIAKKENGKLMLAVRTGDFVHPAMPVAYWKDHDHEEELPGDEIRQCLGLGAIRTTSQDMQFLIDELVEIGLRALSPGVNDPFTAVTSLHWLGAATAQLGQRDLRVRTDVDQGDDDEENQLILIDDNYEHFLKRGMGAMRGAVATSRIASLVFLDTIVNAATTLDDETRRKQLENEGDLLIEQVRDNITGPDLAEIEARYASFAEAIAR